MHFHFCNINHGSLGRLTLIDMYEFIGGGLMELGHTVSIGPLINSGVINVLWEGFVHPSFKEYDLALTNYLRNEKIVYGLIATEIVDFDRGFFNEDNRYNRLRLQSFLSVARNAQFIWSMVDHGIDKYSNHAPTKYIELGFSKYCRPDYVDKIEPIYDVGFYGLPNQYRIEAISNLRNKYKSIKFIWPDQSDIFNTEDLNLFISLCKFGIHLKQNVNWSYPSQSRLARYFTMNRQVISEEMQINTRKSLYCIGPSGKSDFNQYFADQFPDVLSNWKSLGKNVGEKFELEIPIASQLEHFFDVIKLDTSRTVVDYHYIQSVDFSLAMIESNNLAKGLVVEDAYSRKLRRSIKRKIRRQKYLNLIKKFFRM